MIEPQGIPGRQTISPLTGVYPILATPFYDDERLDLDSLERAIRFMKSIGVDGITVLGVLDESNRLTDREREQVVRAAVAAAEGMPVIMGASHPGTRATIELAGMAAKSGASAVMVAPSHEPVPSDERVLEYHERIGKALSLPLVVQDHPASTQVHMPVSLLIRIVENVPGVACIKKEGLPTPARIAALVAGMTRRRVPVLTGLGALYGLFDLEEGAGRFSTGFAFPEVLLAMVRAKGKNDWARVRSLYARFLPLIVFEQQPGVAIRKEILRRRGLLASNRARHPDVGLTPSAERQLQRLLDWLLPGVDLTQPLVL